MPYIKSERREAITKYGDYPENSGELNFLISYFLEDYVTHHGLSYQSCADIVSACENAKDEFQRQVQHPYEDRKIAENGGLYA